MTLQQALEIVAAPGQHERYRWLTSDENPDAEQRDAFRKIVVAKAERAQYPPLAVQAVNALAALGRVASAMMHGEPIKVEPAVYDQRLAICMGCEFNDKRPTGVRCTKCGCGGLKLQLATERCPEGKWPH